MSNWFRPYCANRHFSWHEKSNISKMKSFIVHTHTHTHTHLWVLEISASTLLAQSCAPLLGARVLGFCAPSCVLGYSWWWKVFLLKSIEKDLVGFLSLFWEGFPRIYLVFLCMVFLLVIMVAATFLFMVKTWWN